MIVYDSAVDVKAKQRESLGKTTRWAGRLRASLQPLLEAHGDRVHFRPSSSGIAMVGLLRETPQRGKSGLTNLERVVADFETLFAAHCEGVKQGRATGEKALQSFLIREAYTHGRVLAPISSASSATNEPVELVFVTDEIPLPTADGRIVCDVLALRRDGGRCTPVLLELKDDRMLKRLVAQVEGYAALIDEHADHFAQLFEALLGEPVRFDGPTEKWIVWPAAGEGRDPREEELAARAIRVVTYVEDGEGYSFRVGDRAGSRSPIVDAGLPGMADSSDDAGAEARLRNPR